MSGEILRAPLAAPRISKPPIYDQLVAHHSIIDLDIEGVRKFSASIGFSLEGQSNDSVLGICHRARMQLNRATPKQRLDSECWLRQRGMI